MLYKETKLWLRNIFTFDINILRYCAYRILRHSATVYFHELYRKSKNNEYNKGRLDGITDLIITLSLMPTDKVYSIIQEIRIDEAKNAPTTMKAFENSFTEEDKWKAEKMIKDNYRLDIGYNRNTANINQKKDNC